MANPSTIEAINAAVGRRGPIFLPDTDPSRR
jgi:hypothetical protein